MRTIETKGIVDADGQLSVRVPEDITPGEHRVVVVIDEEAAQSQVMDPADWPVIHIESWPENLSLRREDMYDERGRYRRSGKESDMQGGAQKARDTVP